MYCSYLYAKILAYGSFP